MLGADPGYGKLIAKNPLYEQWIVYVWHEKKWGLTELLEYIPRRKAKWKLKEEIGLGRNCTVFEQSRLYAYSEWRRLKFDDYDRLFQSVYEYAMNLNTDFLVPMLEQEVKCIVRSISKWTVRHMTAAGFSHIQKERNIRSQVVRQNKADERAEAIKAFKVEHPDMSNRMIAQVFEVSEYTIRQSLKT